MGGTLGNQGANALVQRSCNVVVGLPGTTEALNIECGNGTGLDVQFTIHRGAHVTAGSLKPQPNTCDLRIWGLTASHRSQLAKATQSNKVSPGTKQIVIPTIITAGYQGNRATLFSGELRGANFPGEGADKFIADLTTGDGDQALTQARLNLAIPPGSSMNQVFQQILSEMGVQPGNMQKALSLLSANPVAAQIFAKGGALKGSAAEILADLCRSTGFSYSIQNGALSFTQLNQPLDGQAILIDEQHGMIGNATCDTKGVLSVKTLLIPSISPGVKLSVQASNVKGGFRVTSVETRGDTSIGSHDWHHQIEAVRY
jgi:hypothetical protein